MSEPETTLRIVEDATCPGCATLCDDLVLTIDGDRLAKAEGGCARGRAWFAEASGSPGRPAMIRGQATDPDAAIAQAVQILAEAKAPAIWGLSQATIEAQRQAVAIADRVRAIVAIEGSDPGALRAFQRVGEVSASYGEVRDRGDVIVYDATEPVNHLSQFHERFVAPGRRKTVVWIDSETFVPLGIKVDLHVDLFPTRQVAFYQGMRGLINGAFVDRSQLERACGVTGDVLDELVATLKGASYGVFVRNDHASSEAEIEAKLKLVRDLNTFTRFVSVTSGSSAANAAGAKAVLAWQSGAAGDADFSLGYPRYVTGDGMIDRLRRGEVDAILELAAMGDSPALGSTVHRIVIRADVNGWADARPAEVVIPTACPAIDEGGSMMRADGVMLPLRPIFPGRRLTQVEVLHRIEAGLREMAR